MTGSLRYLLAAAFVLVFFSVPEVDHGYVAYLKTRKWLMDEALSSALGDNEDVAELQVDLQEIGGDAAHTRERAADYSRTAREWARGQGKTISKDAPPLLLEVRVGEKGFRATLKRREAGDWAEVATKEVLRAPESPQNDYYPNRNSLIAAFLAIILAILSGKVIPSLLIGCLAGAITYRGGLFDGVSQLAVNNI